MAKPRSGMVRRETRTRCPLSAGKQSNCTRHCGEGGRQRDAPRLRRPAPAPPSAPDSPASCPAPGAAATPAASRPGWSPAPGSSAAAHGALRESGVGCQHGRAKSPPPAEVPVPAAPARTCGGEGQAHPQAGPAGLRGRAQPGPAQRQGGRLQRGPGPGRAAAAGAVQGAVGCRGRAEKGRPCGGDPAGAGEPPRPPGPGTPGHGEPRARRPAPVPVPAPPLLTGGPALLQARRRL